MKFWKHSFFSTTRFFNIDFHGFLITFGWFYSHLLSAISHHIESITIPPDRSLPSFFSSFS